MDSNRRLLLSVEPRLKLALAAARLEPDHQQACALDERDTVKMGRFVVEVIRLGKATREGPAALLGQLVETTDVGLSIPGSVPGGVRLGAFLATQVGTSVATGMTIVTRSLSPSAMAASGIVLIGQKAALSAGLLADTEIQKCQAALAALAASTGAALVLGPVGALGWIALAVSAADAVLQCRGLAPAPPTCSPTSWPGALLRP